VPRTADADLENRILDTAYSLWSKGGEPALTMRAVAIAAGTTTPTVYERFRGKDELIRSLQEHARRKMFFAIKASTSPAEACRRALDFTLTHGREYLLLTSDWAVRLARREPLPSFEFLKKLLARELGGSPARHAKLGLALVAIIHGTAILLLADGVSEKMRFELRHACLAACQSLIHSVSRSGRRPR